MTHSHSHHHHDPEAPRLPLWRLLFRVALAVIIVGLLVAYSMCFQVAEGYKAVVTRFDRPVRSVNQAGLYWKWPWPIEEARQIDVRRELHNTPFTATFTRDRRNVVLETYVVWHVEDPLLYLQSVGTRKDAEEKLNGIVVHYKNEELGRYDLSALVSTKPEEIQTPQIEQAMLADVSKEARQKFGIEVEQVGIKRIAYPEENIPAVLEQMKAERRAEADTLRSQGASKAAEVRNAAETEKAKILGEGVQQAGDIRAEAVAAAAKIYREATLDPQFYEYWKKLQTFKQVVGEKATLILRTDQISLFDVFRSPPERAETPPAAAPAPASTSASATKTAPGPATAAAPGPAPAMAPKAPGQNHAAEETR
jgi:membrane protease subunit HflC